MIRFFKKLFKRGDFMTRADKWYYSKVIKTWLWSAFAFVIIAWVGTNLVLCALTTNVKSGGDVIYEPEKGIVLPSGPEFYDKQYVYWCNKLVFDYYTSEGKYEVDGVNVIEGLEKKTLISNENASVEYYLDGEEVAYVLSNSKMYANPDCTYMCCGMHDYITFNNFDTSMVESMNSMFLESSVDDLDVSSFDTSNVTDMTNMFAYAYINSLNGLENFNTSKVTKMSSMFTNNYYAQELDVSSFDTSKVTDMTSMFYSCPNLQTIYASDKFVTTQVLQSTNMFYNSKKLVGGEGTKWSSSHIDKTYARLDGGPSSSTPGYFTAK